MIYHELFGAGSPTELAVLAGTPGLLGQEANKVVCEQTDGVLLLLLPGDPTTQVFWIFPHKQKAIAGVVSCLLSRPAVDT